MDNIWNQFLDYELVTAIDTNNDSRSFSLTEEAISITVSYLKNPRPMVIVKNNLYQAENLFERISHFIDHVAIYMSEESLRIDNIASSPEYLANRLSILNDIQENKKQIIITHTAALIRYLPNPVIFKDSTIEIAVNSEHQQHQLKETLIKSGYELTSKVDQPLTFSIRGGVIDIFSINHDYPIRIEFFDTEVESIRFFDVATQLTLKQVDKVSIIPATDIIFSDQELSSINEKVNDLLKSHKSHQFFDDLKTNLDRDLDYLNQRINDNSLYKYYALTEKGYTLINYLSDNHQLIYSDISKVQENQAMIQKETTEYIKELFDIGKGLLNTQVFASVDQILSQHPYMNIEQTSNPGTGQHLIHNIDIPISEFLYVMKDITEKAENNIVLLALNEREIKSVIEYFIANNIVYNIYNEDKDLTSGLYITKYPIYEGFYFQNLYVYSSREIFDNQIRTTKYSKKFKESELIDDIDQLNRGDFIVHNNYGVGKYVGIITREMKGVKRDFLKILYRGDDELLVPLQQFNLVRKFISKEGAAPRLNRLGTDEWSKTKEKLNESVNNLAERLVDIYSVRTIESGFAFKKDDKLEQEFGEDISFKLTDDQIKAIQEIEEDMMKPEPMDRLLSGDVGFGKTEVSMRAAFKAVYNGKQVAFLCPTTILSGQHYETFKTRFHNYPVKIEVINRFVPETKQKEIIKKLRNKEIDILIGTHRLLSKDIKYADLGLLIIDEEQRFGVEHKEVIKEIKSNVDVLSLSATPIPRTLQMSLVGIRSLSQLNEAPKNRQPIQTYVIERNKHTINQVIQREVARNGQVFYLHNNVENLSEIARKLKQDMPDLRIGIAHGQMSRDMIENTMIEFTLHEYDVLVCTTIIETGIDISNANTILIDRADTFGLAQLYQIRGRVGRGERIGYCYLMVAPEKQLTEVAQKRLDTIKEFTQLGSGYKIAMRDLTIRGAGDMLGPEQSGFIDTVGIDMYLEMLNKAIKEKSGEKVEVKPEETVFVETKGHIPKDFTNYDYDKINLYQEVSTKETLEDLKEYYQQISDIYGELPKDVALIFESKRLEILLRNPNIEKYIEREQYVSIMFNQEYSDTIDGVQLFALVSELNHNIKVDYKESKISIKIPKDKSWINDTIVIIEGIKTRGD